MKSYDGPLSINKLHQNTVLLHSQYPQFILAGLGSSFTETARRAASIFAHSSQAI